MKDSTLMKLTKKELVERVQIAERNYKIACERLDNQYKNYLKELDNLKNTK